MKLPFPLACAYLGIAVAGYSFIHGSFFAYSHGPVDSALGVAFLLFFAWLLSGPRLMSANSHEEARKSLAFRLGKSLNKVRRGLRG